MAGPLPTGRLPISSTQVALDLLDAARAEARPIRTGDGWPELTLDQAYAVQAASVARRVDRGDRLVGLKLGFTSEAKMRQMGVHEVIVGRLTESTLVADGGCLDRGRLIHPRVEPEIAFRVGRDVDLTDASTDLRTAVDGVCAALEVIDSRYAGFRFDLPRVVADNTSAAAFALGPWNVFAPTVTDGLSVTMRTGDGTAVTGTTDAILGNPLHALDRLGALGARLGLRLSKGDVILAGAATEAVPLPTGRTEVTVQSLGTAVLTVEGA
ncbi:2-keto-4-pentenoate hydratase [Streptomyces sp. NPDC019531]|uniref:2-keto-4-pentenoate hydratase n=1 Tax=Streptomyces sp. NPDC019531 TaxID=3365062 RepID=UPI00384DB156